MGRIERGVYISEYTASEIEDAIANSRIMKSGDATLTAMKARVCQSCGAPMPTPYYCEYCGTHYFIGGGTDCTLYADGEAIARAVGTGGPSYNAGRLPNGKFCP